MFIRTKQTTLLQIFCKIMFNSKVILKTEIDADGSFLRTLGHEWVKVNNGAVL